MTVRCPNCSHQLSLKDENAGETAKCPNCGKDVLIPKSTEQLEQQRKTVNAFLIYERGGAVRWRSELEFPGRSGTHRTLGPTGETEDVVIEKLKQQFANYDIDLFASAPRKRFMAGWPKRLELFLTSFAVLLASVFLFVLIVAFGPPWVHQFDPRTVTFLTVVAFCGPYYLSGYFGVAFKSRLVTCVVWVLVSVCLTVLVGYLSSAVQ